MMKLWIAVFATCVTFAFGSTIAPAATTTQVIPINPATTAAASATTAAAPTTTAAPATTTAAGSNAAGGSTGNSSTAASASAAAVTQTNQTAGNSTTAPSATATPVVNVSAGSRNSSANNAASTPTTTISPVTYSVTEPTTTQAPVYNCTSGEFNTTGLTYSMCSAGCYAVLNNNKITYGCADIVKTALNETWGFEVCSGDKKYGVCEDIIVAGKKSESCVICCAKSNCNDGINNKKDFKLTKPESQNSASSIVANLVSVFIVAISAKLF